jgi:hypothetical protein
MVGMLAHIVAPMPTPHTLLAAGTPHLDEEAGDDLTR